MKIVVNFVIKDNMMCQCQPNANHVIQCAGNDKDKSNQIIRPKKKNQTKLLTVKKKIIFITSLTEIYEAMGF